MNQGGVLESTAAWVSADADSPLLSVAWGDVDGDGDLDLAVGNSVFSSGLCGSPTRSI